MREIYVWRKKRTYTYLKYVSSVTSIFFQGTCQGELCVWTALRGHKGSWVHGHWRDSIWKPSAVSPQDFNQLHLLHIWLPGTMLLILPAICPREAAGDLLKQHSLKRLTQLRQKPVHSDTQSHSLLCNAGGFLLIKPQTHSEVWLVILIWCKCTVNKIYCCSQEALFSKSLAELKVDMLLSFLGCLCSKPSGICTQRAYVCN